MIFYVYAQSNGSAVAFCINTPKMFRGNLIDTMNSGKCEIAEDAVSLLQNMILSEVVKLYDASVWTIRDHVRELEKVNSPAVPSTALLHC